VSVNPPATGTYSGTITISASDSGGGTVQGGSQMVAVTLTVTGINISGVLNACTDSTCATSAPLAGATFALLDSAGTQVAIAVTDGSGNYAFPNLAPGSYTVSVTDSANNHYIAGTLFTVSGDQTGVAVNVYPG